MMQAETQQKTLPPVEGHGAPGRPFSRVWLATAAGGVAALGAISAFIWLRSVPTLAEIRQLADRGQWRAAAAQADAYAARRPNDAQGLMLAARIAAGGGDLERCAELLDRVPHDSPEKLEALYRQGQSLREARYARRAEHAWRSILELAETRHETNSPFVMGARTELVALMSVERRVAEARTLLWQLYSGHSEPWRILINLARIEGQSVYPQMGITLLDECIARDPADLEARRALARYHLSLSDWARAAEQAEFCLAREPQDTDCREILLECRIQLQQWSDADRLLDETDWSAASARMWRLRGQRQEVAGEWAQAEQSLRETLARDAADPTTHFQLSQLLRRLRAAGADEHHAEFRRLQEFKEAINALIASYATMEPTDWVSPDAATCVKLARNCAGLGRTREARAWLHEALRQEPDLAAAQDALGEIQADEP